MRSLRSILACVFLVLARPLAAQYVSANGDVQILVPQPPLVKSPITNLLIVACKEKESFLVAKALQEILAANPRFKVARLEEDNPLSKEITTLEALTKDQRDALATAHGASHMMLIRLSRFDFKEKKSREVVRTATGTVTTYKWLGQSYGQLLCPVLELRTGLVTPLIPQNLAKEYYKENVNFLPVPEPASTAREDLVKVAARKALQMVVTVQVKRPLPFMTNGALDTIYKPLKAGNLDEALRVATALAAASTGESSKFQARIQYDLGLLQCLANRPELALEALQTAQKAGYDKAEVQMALESCQAILAARAPSA